jgi:hypothetical protein
VTKETQSSRRLKMMPKKRLSFFNSAGESLCHAATSRFRKTTAGTASSRNKDLVERSRKEKAFVGDVATHFLPVNLLHECHGCTHNPSLYVVQKRTKMSSTK